MAGLALGNALLGLANIGAGIGFGVEEKKMMGKLNKKSNKLKDSVTSASNLYDHIYYLIAVNLKRFKKSLDKLPNDFLDKVNDKIRADISGNDLKKALQTAATWLGYVGAGVNVLSSIAELAIKLRERKASGAEEPTDPTEPTESPFEKVPTDGNPPTPPEEESSIPKSSRLKTFAKGLEYAGVVFGVAGLAVTIGLGTWELVQLEKAISDVEEKQIQVDAFQKAMTDVLDPMVKSAGLPAKSYKELTTMAGNWKKMSENFDSYEKPMYYAIRGYFMKNPFAKIKSMVDKESDAGKPFPKDGYPLAATLAGDIKYQFDQKKTDKEVVAFFATENPKIGLRFVFDEFFISSLHGL